MPDGFGEHDGLRYMVMELAGSNMADMQAAARWDPVTILRAGDMINAYDQLALYQPKPTVILPIVSMPLNYQNGLRGVGAAILSPTEW